MTANEEPRPEKSNVVPMTARPAQPPPPEQKPSPPSPGNPGNNIETHPADEPGYGHGV